MLQAGPPRVKWTVVINFNLGSSPSSTPVQKDVIVFETTLQTVTVITPEMLFLRVTSLLGEREDQQTCM